MGSPAETPLRHCKRPLCSLFPDGEREVLVSQGIPPGGGERGLPGEAAHREPRHPAEGAPTPTEFYKAFCQPEGPPAFSLPSFSSAVTPSFTGLMTS